MYLHKRRVEYRDSNFDQTAAIEADEWLRLFSEKVHPLLDTDKKTREQHHAPRVKIAIIDTGIDLPESSKDFYSGRVKDIRSWVPPSKNLRGGSATKSMDLDGHGTHAAGLILDVARDADLFVAKVFNQRKEGQDGSTAEMLGKRISKAIYYAIHEWKVDIISMSFGFDEQVESMYDAICDAYKSRVLIVASASNHGGNQEPTWPATSPMVIGIHACSGAGRKYKGNTTPRSFSDNFSTLGVAVESWWPAHLGQGVRKRSSGTSCAAPIAAGIAAVVIAVSRQPERVKNLSAKNLRKLKRLGTSDGMAAVFRRMVIEERDGYCYLVPWKLLDHRHSSPQTIVDNIISVL